MAIPRFFGRTFSAIGRAISIQRHTLAAVVDETVVGVRCHPHDSNDSNTVWSAEMSTNLLARLYPRLSIDGPSGVVDGLRALAFSINPEIELVNTEPTVAIHLGMPANTPIGTNHIVSGASGWVAGIGTLFEVAGAANPFSAAFAGALAVSEVFRIVFARYLSDSSRSEPTSVSLLDWGETTGHNEPLPSVDLGEIALVGLGAVGNAAVWALSRLPEVRCTACLIDHEAVELSNLQRYVLATDRDVGVLKPDLARSRLDGPGWKASVFNGRLEDFAKERCADGPFDMRTMLVGTDDVASRRSAQALLPRLLVNAWTSECGFGGSWHEFGNSSACLACLYQPDRIVPSETDVIADIFGLTKERAALLWVMSRSLTDAELAAAGKRLGIADGDLAQWKDRPLPEIYTRLACGAVTMDASGVGRLDAVPLAHQSAFAGVIAAAELVKRLVPTLSARSQVEPLVVWHDVRGRIPRRWGEPRARRPGCICSDSDYLEAYREKWPTRG
ncbi:MAG: ThiF family adenylyltransferase [Polyangiales bacterium]